MLLFFIFLGYPGWSLALAPSFIHALCLQIFVFLNYPGRGTFPSPFLVHALCMQIFYLLSYSLRGTFPLPLFWYMRCACKCFVFLSYSRRGMFPSLLHGSYDVHILSRLSLHRIRPDLFPSSLILFMHSTCSFPHCLYHHLRHGAVRSFIHRPCTFIFVFTRHALARSHSPFLLSFSTHAVARPYLPVLVHALCRFFRFCLCAILCHYLFPSSLPLFMLYACSCLLVSVHAFFFFLWLVHSLPFSSVTVLTYWGFSVLATVLPLCIQYTMYIVYKDDIWCVE